MKVVSPYRPFEPESPAHLRLGVFDWTAALKMLAVSVGHACACETFAITDVDTSLKVPAYQFETRHRRLMLWLLEASLRYLESPAFDQDTVMLSPDTLVYGDLRFGFAADLGIIARVMPKFANKKPLLNGVQWWAHAAKDRLVAFYQRALAMAETLTESAIRWGADTIPLVALLAPIRAGLFERDGLTVYGWPHVQTLGTPSALDLALMDRGRSPLPPTCPVVDFKYLKKRYMAAYYQATVGQVVLA